jgi:hypothetical protein
MFCATGLAFGGIEGVRSGFNLLCSRTLLHDTEGVGSRFLVLRSRILFRLYRGRRVPFECCALHDSFWAVPRASGPIFMFCAPVFVLGCTEGVGSHFHVWLSQTHFRRCRGRLVQFSYLALPNSFGAVLRASGPVYIFCALGVIFDGIEGVGSRFHVLPSRTRF